MTVFVIVAMFGFDSTVIEIVKKKEERYFFAILSFFLRFLTIFLARPRSYSLVFCKNL